MKTIRVKAIAFVSAALLALPVLSCSDRTLGAPSSLLSPGGPSRQALPAGQFTWIAPLGTGTPNPATFDAAAATSVQICVWVSNACSGAPVATFIPGDGSLVANTTVGEYEANWNLNSATLAIRKTYRISAMRGSTELGGVLVDAIRTRWALTHLDGTVAPLIGATSLAIRFHVAVVPLAGVKINEIESNGGIPDDWVELYNPTTAAIDLSNFEFRDNDDTHHFFLPAGSTIAPGGYLVLDGNNATDPTKFSFGLGSADAARLFDQYGRLVDSYSWTAHAVVTYGRCPNGTGAFAQTTTSTKGSANDCSVPVKINEVQSKDPNGGMDWIELYNPSGITVDLSGYKLGDNDGNSFTIPNGTMIAGGAFLVFTQNDPNSFTFGLGNKDGANFSDPSGTLLDSFSWTTQPATSWGRCPDASGPFVATATITKGAANDCGGGSTIKISEVESNDPDFIELTNTGKTTVDLSGFLLRDDGDSPSHTYTIPAGTMLAPGAFKAFDALPFGLGSSDKARLYNQLGVVLDTTVWTMHPPTSHGRCPDPLGTATTPFIANVAVTKGAANSCPTAWPGGGTIATVDLLNAFPSNLSGLIYEIGTGPGGADVLWGIRNDPSTMYRLVLSGGNWIPATDNNWSSGRLLHYPDGTGNPDAEDLTYTTGSSAGMYVATERDNANGGVSRPAILRFDPTSSAAELNATHVWDLTADLPVVGPNLGLEGIAWIPDTYLVSKGFFDDHAGHTYNPAEYADHAGGLFFVGLEGNGMVYVYALNHTNSTFTRITAFFTGFPMGVMSVHFDRDLGYLWATCDDTCGGLHDIFEIDVAPGSPTLGHMRLTHIFNRPSGMANFNNEGFAFTPLSLCSSGFRPVFWADDSNDNGHALRQGTLTCSATFP